MEKQELKLSLFILRLGVFIVMLIWTLDKFVRPEHTAIVFKKFYMVPVLSSNISYVVGGIQALFILAFLFGIKKKFSYGLILVIHAISTLSSYSQYLNPWEGGNILFFAAWPMLSAIIALYLLREHDTLLTIKIF